MAWLDSAVVMAVLPPCIVAVPFATMWRRPALRPVVLPISIMVPLLLVHPTVTTTALAPFTCREIGDHSYLESDFAWRCDDTAVVVTRWLLGLPMLLPTRWDSLTYYVLLRASRSTCTRACAPPTA